MKSTLKQRRMKEVKCNLHGTIPTDRHFYIHLAALTAKTLKAQMFLEEYTRWNPDTSKLKNYSYLIYCVLYPFSANQAKISDVVTCLRTSVMTTTNNSLVLALIFRKLALIFDHIISLCLV